MPDLSHLEPTLVGVAGEYFVAAELSLRGCLASVTLRNSRGIDIIASSADASKSNRSGSRPSSLALREIAAGLVDETIFDEQPEEAPEGEVPDEPDCAPLVVVTRGQHSQ